MRRIFETSIFDAANLASKKSQLESILSEVEGERLRRMKHVDQEGEQSEEKLFTSSPAFFEELVEYHGSMRRREIQKSVIEAQEIERGRRVSAELNQNVLDELTRFYAQKKAINSAEKERQRRIGESVFDDAAKEGLRKLSTSFVRVSQEKERERRLSMEGEQQLKLQEGSARLSELFLEGRH